jgi:hypothetical protein
MYSRHSGKPVREIGGEQVFSLSLETCSKHMSSLVVFLRKLTDKHQIRSTMVRSETRCGGGKAPVFRWAVRIEDLEIRWENESG